MRSHSRLDSCARNPPPMQSRLGNGGGIDGSLWRERETTPRRPATDNRWPRVGEWARAILMAAACRRSPRSLRVCVAGKRCDWRPGVAGPRQWSACWPPRSWAPAEERKCSNGRRVPTRHGWPSHRTESLPAYCSWNAVSATAPPQFSAAPAMPVPPLATHRFPPPNGQSRAVAGAPRSAVAVAAVADQVPGDPLQLTASRRGR